MTWIIICLHPDEAIGRRKRLGNFIALKPGVYEPLDSDLNGFDAEFSGTLALGEYTSENFAWALELSNLNTSFEDSDEKDDVTIYGAKIIWTWIKRLGRRGRGGEIFFSLGGGAYLVDVEIDDKLNRRSDNDDDYVFGGEVGLGGNYNLSNRFFIGVEGRYVYTTDVEATLFSTALEKFSLEGYTVTGIVGLRFDLIRIFRNY